MSNNHKNNIIRVIAVLVLLFPGAALMMLNPHAYPTHGIHEAWHTIRNFEFPKAQTDIRTVSIEEPELPYPPTDQTSISLGKKLYYSDELYCYTCHGENGDGDGFDETRNLIDNIWIHGDSREAFYNSIKTGTEDGAMPAYTITIQQADAIRAFLHSLKETSR